MQGSRCGGSITGLHFLCSCLAERLCPEGVAAGLTEGQRFNGMMIQKVDSSSCLPVTSYVVSISLSLTGSTITSYYRLLRVTYWHTVQPLRFWWLFLVEPL